jgi:CubicO group peptidase (beta-lactamase class C family)
VISCLPAWPQSLEKSIDSLMLTQYKPDGTGAVALVSKKGEVIYKKAFGLANFELNVPMSTDMVFEIASMTKQFTATAILMLEEEGKLSVNDDITKYIDFPTRDKITIHMLLNHTAGLRDLQMMDYISFSCGKREFKPVEYIERFKQEPVLFKPGEKWDYNNPGYFLLGYIIEKVSGLKYETFIQQRIFDPLQMTQSYCQVGNIRELIKNRAYGYDVDQNIYNAEFLYMFQAYSAGCILSTVEDMNKWNAGLNAYKLLKKENTERLYTNYKLNNGENTNCGYGFFLNNINGSPSYEHGGGAPGFASNGIYLPKEDVYVVVLSNCKGNDPEKISLYIAGLAIDKPLKRTKAKMSEEKLKEYAGTFKYEKDSVLFDITFENSNLYYQKKNYRKMPVSKRYRILPYKPDNFFAVDKFYEFEFIRNEKSQITGIIVKTRRRMQIETGIK